MKIDIPYYIRQVLREQRMVTIPGIGTFKLEQASALFNDDKSVLSPPVLNIIFDDTETDDSSLMKYILDTGLISESKAKKKLNQYTQAAFNKLLNVNSFKIEGIGLVTRNEGEDKVHFEPQVQKLTKEFDQLNPISLSPISRISEQNLVAANVTSNPPVKESGSFLPRIIILSLLLIALYFLGRYLYNNFFMDTDSEKIGLIDDKEDGSELTFDDSDQDDLEQKYEEIDELIDPDNRKKAPTQSGNAKLDEELDNLEKDPDLKTGEGEMGGTGNSNNANANVSNESGEQGLDSKSDSTKAALLDKSGNKHADIIPETGECIIIVGSFMKSLNTIKMVSLLERKGYKVHQEEYKGLNRVGIKYECLNEDLESYLQDIRKTISSKAWYLDPELEVPYLK